MLGQTITNRLFPKQSTIRKILTNPHSLVLELLIGGGAGGAKSTTGCMRIITMATQYPETRWLLGRSELASLKVTTYNTFKDVAKHNFGLVYGKDYVLTPLNVIRFSNGSEVVLMDMKYYPNKDPDFDKLGSTEFTGWFLDEVAQITLKAYQVASSRVGRYKNEKYWIPWILLMSCNPTKWRPYKEFYKKQRDGVIEPHKRFIQVLARHNPYIAKSYIERLSRLPEWALKERLYHGNWEYDDTPGILFEIPKIEKMFRTQGLNPYNEKYIIVDVARHGVDRTTAIYWEGLQWTVLRYEEKSDMDLLQERLKEECLKRWVRITTNLLVDEDWIGGWVVDNLWCQWFLNNGAIIENDEWIKPNYQNLKTQCAFALSQYVQDGLIGLKCDWELEEIIQEELHVIREIDLDKDWKRRISTKKDMKLELWRSPDWADNLIMRMFYEVHKIPDYTWAVRKKK